MPAGVLYHFELEVDDDPYELPIGEQALLPITVRDLSKDGPGALAEGAPTVPVRLHSVEFFVTPLMADTEGWVPQPVPGFTIVPGETKETNLLINLGPTATNKYFPVNLTAVIRTDDGYRNLSAQLAFFTNGLPGFALRALNSLDNMEPGEIRQVKLVVNNIGLTRRAFDVDILQNPCKMGAPGSGTFVVEPRSSKQIEFSVRAPTNKVWYYSQDCSLQVEVTAADSPGAPVATSVGVTVNGWYVKPDWLFAPFWTLVIIAILVFVIARRKARIEEEILGKPQKPWTIPVEVVYLKHLKERDPRAWYVVRHYLMEDEYKSALLWYSTYKAATKGGRKKERLVLKQEHSYEAWRRRWEKRVARPMKLADRFDADLQRKLDRTATKRLRVETGKYLTLTRKMKSAHESAQDRAFASWEKQVAKAQKKGTTAPPKPTVAEPDYAPEPQLQEIALADHRWSKKAGRYRRRMVRKQGNLEVRFEKADTRMLRKVRRKVQRVARKLDDPAFVAEHPLLQG